MYIENFTKVVLPHSKSCPNYSSRHFPLESDAPDKKVSIKINFMDSRDYKV